MRWSNSDPITGQAAWYDLRVDIQKADAQAGPSEPKFGHAGTGDNATKPDQHRYGQEW